MVSILTRSHQGHQQRTRLWTQTLCSYGLMYLYHIYEYIRSECTNKDENRQSKVIQLTYGISRAASVMQPCCNVIQSYVITISAGKPNLDSARNFTSHYGVKQLLYKWLHGYIWRYRFCSLGRSQYEFQQPANDSAGSTIKPQGSPNRAKQTHINGIRKTWLGEKRLQKQTSGTTQEEGVMVEGVNSTTQSAAEHRVKNVQNYREFEWKTGAWSEIKHFGRGI